MDENFQFTEIEKDLVTKYSQSLMPINAGFELTPYCNMCCKICYVHETKPGLPLLKKEQWIDLAHQAADLGVLFILLTGGEPLLHPDFKDIYVVLKKMGMILTINTNGTLIDKEMADFLAVDPPRRINLSLYGVSDNVYEQLCGVSQGFTRTKRAIELLLERKIPVKINIIANKINYPYLDEMYDFCREYNLPVEANSYLFEPIRKSQVEYQKYRLSSKQMADANLKWDRYRYSQEQMMVRSAVAYEALSQYRQIDNCQHQCIQCRAGISSFWICWDGHMTPCVNMLTPRKNVLKDGIKEAWNAIVKGVSQIKISGKCKHCSLNNFCQTCAAIAYHENGAFGEVPQIICETTMEQVKMLASSVKKIRKEEL